MRLEILRRYRAHYDVIVMNAHDTHTYIMYIFTNRASYFWGCIIQECVLCRRELVFVSISVGLTSTVLSVQNAAVTAVDRSARMWPPRSQVDALQWRHMIVTMSHITDNWTVCSTVCSDAKKHQSSQFLWNIVTWKFLIKMPWISE